MWKNGSHKGRIDGHLTSKIYTCSAEGSCDQKHIDNAEQVRELEPLTRCSCEVDMQFKRIKDIDYWIVMKFATKHTYRLAKPSDVLYIKFYFSSFNVIFGFENIVQVSLKNSKRDPERNFTNARSRQSSQFYCKKIGKTG